MRRDVLLLEEMTEAAVQAMELVEGVVVEDRYHSARASVGSRGPGAGQRCTGGPGVWCGRLSYHRLRC